MTPVAPATLDRTAEAGHYRCLVVGFQDFVDEEQIGEQRAQVDRRVEIVDDLRADRRQREYELNRGLRIFRVAIDDVDEAVVRRGGTQRALFDPAREHAGETAQRRRPPWEVR